MYTLGVILKWILGVFLVVVLVGAAIYVGAKVTDKFVELSAAKQQAQTQQAAKAKDSPSVTSSGADIVQQQSLAVDPVVVGPAAAVPTVDPTAVPAVFDQADQLNTYKGNTDMFPDFRERIRNPGDEAMFVLRFAVDCNGCLLSRVWPDDFLVLAVFTDSTGKQTDLLPLLDMITIPLDGSGTGDKDLDKALKARGVNIAQGELLPQNQNQVMLGDVKSGSYIVYYVKDDPNKQVNRGMGMVLGTTVDSFTVDLSGNQVTP